MVDSAGRGEDLLREQLRNVQEECRKLRLAYKQGEGRASLSRSHSSQSLPQFPLSHSSTDHIPPTSHNYTSHSLYVPTTSSHLPPSYATHRPPSPNGSTASASSIKSTQSERDLFTYRPTTSDRTPLYTPKLPSSTPRGGGPGHGGREKKEGRFTHWYPPFSSGLLRGGGSKGVNGGAGRRKEGKVGGIPGVKVVAQGRGWGAVGSQWAGNSCGHLVDSGYSSTNGGKLSTSLLSSDGELGGRGEGFSSSMGGSHVNTKHVTSVPTSRSGPLSLTNSLPTSPTSSSHILTLPVPATVSSFHLTADSIRSAREREAKEEGGGRKGRESSRKEEMEERELVAAHSRIRQLEREVVVLEQQLEEKMQSSRSHVEQLTCMRSELTREKAVLARERQESREAASLELERERSAHTAQLKQLQAQLEELVKEKREGDREIGSLRASLKGCQSEAAHLSDTVSRLSRQLKEEEKAHAHTTRELHRAGEEGRTQVARLEHSLRACQEEVEAQLGQVQAVARGHQQETEQLKRKVSSLSSSLSSASSQLQDRASTISRLQQELAGTRACLQKEEEGRKRREEEVEAVQEESEAMRGKLLGEVEQSRRELERVTAQLSQLQKEGREGERSRAENQQLKKMVSELQQSREEMERERKRRREERQQLQKEHGLLQTQLESAKRQLQQTKEREQDFSQVRAELARETEHLRVESQKVRAHLEACERELDEARDQLKGKESEAEERMRDMRHELTTRGKQVLEMEQLLHTHQAEAVSRQLELDRGVARAQSDLHTRTQQLQGTTDRLRQAQKVTEELRAQLTQLQFSEKNISSEQQKQLLAQEADLTRLRERVKELEAVGVAKDRELVKLRGEVEECVRRGRVKEERERELQAKMKRAQKEQREMKEAHASQLKALQERHSSLLSSSEEEAASHQRTLHQLSSQQLVRQEELGRCRAQVAALSLELAAERKMTEQLGQQLTLARAESTRHQAQVSSMQRSLSLAAVGIGTGKPKPSLEASSHLTPSHSHTSHSHTTHAPSIKRPLTTTTVMTNQIPEVTATSGTQLGPTLTTSNGSHGQQKGQVIDM